LYSVIIGSVGVIVRDLDHVASERKEHLDKINDFLNFNEVPGEVREKIRSFYDYRWTCRHGMDADKTLFNDLPPGLSLELQFNLKSRFVRNVQLFNDLSVTAIQALVLKMKPLIVLPREIVINEGEVGEEMFWINRGIVQVMRDDEKEGMNLINRMGAGSHFGEIALVNTTSTKRTASVMTVTFCDLQVLDKTDLDIVKRISPELTASLDKAASAYKSDDLEATDNKSGMHNHKSIIRLYNGQSTNTITARQTIVKTVRRKVRGSILQASSRPFSTKVGTGKKHGSMFMASVHSTSNIFSSNKGSEKSRRATDGDGTSVRSERRTSTSTNMARRVTILNDMSSHRHALESFSEVLKRDLAQQLAAEGKNEGEILGSKRRAAAAVVQGSGNGSSHKEPMEKEVPQLTSITELTSTFGTSAFGGTSLGSLPSLQDGDDEDRVLDSF
jgi:voltage-gated potassium channel